MHRPDMIQDWEQSNRLFEVIDSHGKHDRQKGSQAESMLRSEVAPHIKHLIVATKASVTANAMAAVESRLSHESTILFVQNGMGMCLPRQRYMPTLKWLA